MALLSKIILFTTITAGNAFGICPERILKAARPALVPPSHHHRIPDSDNPKISAVLPEFDASTDLLFLFRGDGHASFIVGERRLDWGGAFSGHRSRHLVPSGVVVRVTIGTTLVDRLREAIDKQAWGGIHAVTCLHSELVFLQSQGIRLAAPSFLGTSIYASLLHKGLVDEKGTSFPQEVYVIHPDPNTLSRTHDAMTHSQRGFFARFLLAAGVTPGQLLSAMGLPPEMEPALVAYFEGRLETLPPNTHWSGYTWMLHFQKALVALIQSHAGMELPEAMAVFARNRDSLPRDQLHALVIEAARIATQSFLSTP